MCLHFHIVQYNPPKKLGLAPLGLEPLDPEPDRGADYLSQINPTPPPQRGRVFNKLYGESLLREYCYSRIIQPPWLWAHLPIHRIHPLYRVEDRIACDYFIFISRGQYPWAGF